MIVNLLNFQRDAFGRGALRDYQYGRLAVMRRLSFALFSYYIISLQPISWPNFYSSNLSIWIFLLFYEPSKV
jgi:hypothetical protein